MRAIATTGLAALVLFGASVSISQPASDADKAGDETLSSSVQKKRAECRQAGTAQGLRGPDLADHVLVCVQEARLTCLKQAVQQKVRGPERINFIDKCLGS